MSYLNRSNKYAPTGNVNSEPDEPNLRPYESLDFTVMVPPDIILTERQKALLVAGVSQRLPDIIKELLTEMG